MCKNKPKAKKCYNCIYATKQFKVGKLTHIHCCSPAYEEMNDKGNPPCAWETLRVFSDTCDEFKQKKMKNKILSVESEFDESPYLLGQNSKETDENPFEKNTNNWYNWNRGRNEKILQCKDNQ